MFGSIVSSLVVVMSATSLVLVSFVMHGDLTMTDPSDHIRNPASTFRVTVENDAGKVEMRKGGDVLLRLDDTNGLQLLPLQNVSAKTGLVRFYELARNGVQYVELRSPDALAGNVSFILPIADGLSGYILETDGNGQMSWNNPLTVDSTRIADGAGTTFIDTDIGAGNITIVAVSGLTATITGPASYTSTGETHITGANGVIIQDLTYPAVDGTSGQVLSTNGAAALSWINTDADSTKITDSGGHHLHRHRCNLWIHLYGGGVRAGLQHHRNVHLQQQWSDVDNERGKHHTLKCWECYLPRPDLPSSGRDRQPSPHHRWSGNTQLGCGWTG